MNLAELTKVAEIINKLSLDAKEGLVYYISFNFIDSFISYLVAILAIFVVHKLIKIVLDKLWTESEAIVVLKKLRELLNIGSNGVLTEREIKSIIDKVTQLKKAYEDKK